jgi:hypothetical protein
MLKLFLSFHSFSNQNIWLNRKSRKLRVKKLWFLVQRDWKENFFKRFYMRKWIQVYAKLISHIKRVFITKMMNWKDWKIIIIKISKHQIRGLTFGNNSIFDVRKIKIFNILQFWYFAQKNKKNFLFLKIKTSNRNQLDQ